MKAGAGRWWSRGMLAGVALGALGVFWLAQGRVLRGAAALFVALAIVTFVRSRSRRYATFALVTVVLATILPLGGILGLDLYLHRRYAASGGYNVWGYRGETVGARRPGERRIAVLGGSAAFGYGVRADQTFPWYLERKLSEAGSGHGAASVRVINLAWNGEGAHAFRSTIEDYDYLDPDVVLLYSGYNDLAPNTGNFRRESAIFRATGYLPILHVLPIDRWLRSRELSVTRDDRVVFQPNLVDRSAAQAADMALQITKALEQQMDRLAGEAEASDGPRTGTDCGRWEHYCQAMHAAIAAALAQGRHVVVVTEPYVGGGGKPASLHISQQSTLVATLAARFPAESRLHYVNMGRAVDLADRALCYDGLHLTPEGNAALAARLAPWIDRVVHVAASPPKPATPFRMFDAGGKEAALAARGRWGDARVLFEAASHEAASAGDAATASAITARAAIAEWAVGNGAQAVALADAAVERHRGPTSLWTGALLHGLVGDLDRAIDLAGEFARSAPQGGHADRLWLPMLEAAIEDRRGATDEGMHLLESTVVHESVTYWSRYLRGLIHLRNGRGFEAEEEFLRILGQPELDSDDPLYVTSRRHLASARVLHGAAERYGETFQAFFAAWKGADPGLPVLESARAQYLELRKSIGMPPLPF